MAHTSQQARHREVIRRRADTPLIAQVFAALSRGGFHSGSALAQELGVSRGAVWKAATGLKDLGLTVHAVRNRGYRLPERCEPLDAERIRAQLADVRTHVRDLQALWSIPSTNASLLARTDLPVGSADVLLAEYQTAGRGRRGRHWLAPPGGAICLSLSWNFPQVPPDLGALGLAIGVCALRALQPRVQQKLTLKWPNDLLADGRKLGGILIELRAESSGPAYVVVGVGINVVLGAALLEAIAATGVTAIDLKSAGADPVPRNAMVGDLVSAIVPGLRTFEREGLRPFAEAWSRADALAGRAVHVLSGNERIEGIARGIDPGGALLVETAQGPRRFLSGDVSIRPAT